MYIVIFIDYSYIYIRTYMNVYMYVRVLVYVVMDVHVHHYLLSCFCFGMLVCMQVACTFDRVHFIMNPHCKRWPSSWLFHDNFRQDTGAWVDGGSGCLLLVPPSCEAWYPGCCAPDVDVLIHHHASMICSIWVCCCIWPTHAGIGKHEFGIWIDHLRCMASAHACAAQPVNWLIRRDVYYIVLHKWIIYLHACTTNNWICEVSMRGP